MCSLKLKVKDSDIPQLTRACWATRFQPSARLLTGEKGTAATTTKQRSTHQNLSTLSQSNTMLLNLLLGAFHEVLLVGFSGSGTQGRARVEYCLYIKQNGSRSRHHDDVQWTPVFRVCKLNGRCAKVCCGVMASVRVGMAKADWERLSSSEELAFWKLRVGNHRR